MKYIYIIPILNPDSHDIFEYFVRGTSQLLDKNGDGIPSNDLYADITGDEWIGYLYTTDESKTRTGDIGYESKDLDGNGWLGDDSWLVATTLTATLISSGLLNMPE